MAKIALDAAELRGATGTLTATYDSQSFGPLAFASYGVADIDSLPLASASELSVTIEAHKWDDPRTYMGELYTAVASGSATLLIDATAQQNVLVDFVWTYSGTGMAQSRATDTKGYRGDVSGSFLNLSDLSTSIGRCGGMLWTEPGTKTITVTAIAWVGTTLKRAVHTFTRNFRDSLDVPAAQIRMVSPTSNFPSDRPSGVLEYTSASAAMQHGVAATGTVPIVVMLEAGVTHDAGFVASKNVSPDITIVPFNPSQFSDHSGRATLQQGAGTHSRVLQWSTPGASPSETLQVDTAVLAANIDFTGNYDALTGTGDLIDGLFVLGAEKCSVYNCTVDGLMALAKLQTTGESTFSIFGCEGTNWQDIGAFGFSQELVYFGNSFEQPDGVTSDSGKGAAAPRPDHASMRWTSSTTNGRYGVGNSYITSDNGWTGANNGALRLMFSLSSPGPVAGPDLSGHFGSVAGNFIRGGYVCVQLQPSSPGYSAWPGGAVVSHNWIEGGPDTIEPIGTSYGGTVARDNCIYMPQIDSTFGSNRLVKALSVDDGTHATNEGDNASRECFAFGNTFINEQTAAQLTNGNGQQSFSFVNGDAALSVTEGNNAVFAPGYTNAGTFDIGSTDTFGRPRAGNSALSGKVSGDLLSRIDATSLPRSRDGARGWLDA